MSTLIVYMFVSICPFEAHYCRWRFLHDIKTDPCSCNGTLFLNKSFVDTNFISYVTLLYCERFSFYVEYAQDIMSACTNGTNNSSS